MAEKGMARLGALIPSYRLAMETYTELVGLNASASTLEEITTVAGQRLRDVEAAIARESAGLPMIEEVGPTRVESAGPPLKKPDHLCISLDGAKVNTTEGWREVKVVSVSDVEELSEAAADGTRVTLANHSYRAGFWEAKDFGEEQWAEAQSRGVERAKRVTSVDDGAPWIWGLILMCYPAALQVVDWWHVVERLWKVANLVLGQGTEAAGVWMEARKDELWEGRVLAVIAALGKLEPRGEDAKEEVRLLAEYLRTHAGRMRYREFRESGAPVGSGTVESACKNVVGSRMKRGGMRWKVERAEGVLALRCALLSGRWKEAWDKQRPAA